MHQGLPILLQITKIAADGGTVLRLAGRLSDDDVVELESVCSDASWPILLDLSELRNADDSGLAAIWGLVTQGAELAHVSAFTVLLLEDEETQASGG